MRCGRFPKLSYPKVRQIDKWFFTREILVKQMCARLGIASQTLYDARNRVRAYKDVPRETVDDLPW